METESPSIAVNNLTKRYGPLTAIKDVSFSVQSGEVVGFLGPNGAGKSTTMRILCGIIPATSGTAEVCGRHVPTHPAEIKRLIGYMPETNPLPEDMRVAEYLRYRGKLKEIPAGKLKERVETAMEMCDLARTARKKIIGNLSKGFRQRVGIADAILAEPEVIIMDEPTIGLDPHQVIAIRKLIDSLRGKMTVIISSHILAEVEMCCDRVIIINRGCVVASGTPGELRRKIIPDTQYHVTAAASPVQLQERLATVNAEITVEARGDAGNGLHDFTANAPGQEDQSEQFVAALGSTPGIRLASFRRDVPTLEDIFLAATQRSWEQETPLPRKAAPGGGAPARTPEPVTQAAEQSGEPSSDTHA